MKRRLLATTMLLLGSNVAAEVPRVDNPAEAPAARTVELEKLWEVGGFSDTPGEFFGKLYTLDVDSQGRVYLLDVQLKEVRVFSPDGRYLRTTSHEGEGPGELLRPSGLTMLPGDTLCVLQTSPPRRSLFDADGDYTGELPLPGSLFEDAQRVTSVRFGGGRLVVGTFAYGAGPGYVDSTTRVYSLAPGDSTAAPFAEFTYHNEFSEHVVKEAATNPLRWSVGRDGRCALTRGYDYAIEIWSPAGRLERVITRDIEHRMRSKAERDSVVAAYRRGGGTEGLDIEVMDHVRDVEWMALRGDGGLWVLSSRGVQAGLDPGCLGTFDCYDAKGRLVEELRLLGEGSLGADRYFLAGDRLYVLRRYAEAFSTVPEPAEESSDEEPEPMSVICYRLPESPTGR